ncbi:unnamed protein product, partial [marine sediment metagenome]
IWGGFFSLAMKTVTSIIGHLWKAFTSVTSIYMVQAFHSLIENNPEEAKVLWAKICDTYFETDPEWAGIVGRYMKSMTGMDIDVSDITTAAFTSAESLGETFLYPMLNLVLPGGAPIAPGAPPTEAKLKPADGLEGAERFLGTNLRFQMQAW